MGTKMDPATSGREVRTQGADIKRSKLDLESTFKVNLGTKHEQPDLEEFLAELAISLWLAKEQEQKAA